MNNNRDTPNPNSNTTTNNKNVNYDNDIESLRSIFLKSIEIDKSKPDEQKEEAAKT